MDKKNAMIVGAVALVFAGGGFFGGTKYAQAKRTAQNAVFRNGTTGGAFVRRNGQPGGGFTGGQIIAQDDKSITIKTQDGGSKIVFLAPSTQIAKSAAGTVADLSQGTDVVVTGTTNSDGSLTAQMVQIRPAMPSPSK